MTDIDKALAEGLEDVPWIIPEAGELAAALAATPSMQEVARLAAIGAVVEGVGVAPGEVARGYLRRHGFVFDKWPPDAARPADRIEDYDPETRWQGLAFSLYNDLCEYEYAIAAALGEDAIGCTTCGHELSHLAGECPEDGCECGAEPDLAATGEDEA